MDNKKKTLQDIFDEDDDLGLLNVKPLQNAAKNADDRLVSTFQDINHFVEKHGHAPQQGGGLQEHQLFSRLQGFRKDPKKSEMLRAYDCFNLLQENTKTYNNLDEILEDTEGAFLEDDTAGLFDFKHIKRPHERVETDFVAQRKPCPNFLEYADLFKNVQKNLKESKRKLVQFTQNNLRAGDFYVHNGVLLYLESVNWETKTQNFRSGERDRTDGRTRIIFENGTESNMLYRSLYKLLLANGKAISKDSDSVADTLSENFNNITNTDKPTGYIYILTSKSSNPAIQTQRNLYKIGYSTTPVADRIKNAAKEPTYLMAAVAIIAEYKCFNLNPQPYEQLLHNFFGEVCLNIDLYDGNGKRYSPREWFVVPLEVIDKVIELLLSGEIVEYQYDAVREEIRRKNEHPRIIND